MDASTTIIKICGITRLQDGLGALAAGADWLGFIRWPGSSRFRPLDEARELIRQLRCAVAFEAVGVYVDATRDQMEREAEELGLDRIQLHGDESPELAASLSRPALKAIRVRDAQSLRRAEDYQGVDILTDADHPTLRGGTGRGYDYELLRELSARRRVFVAGGLKAANVAAVLGALRPAGVDVSSSIESEPGVKDQRLLWAFVEAVRLADASVAAGQGATHKRAVQSSSRRSLSKR